MSNTNPLVAAFMLRTVGHGSLTVGVEPVGLASIPDGATAALVSIEDAPVRATFSAGADPTVGHLFPTGDRFQITAAADLAACRLVRAGDSDAVIRITYYA